MMKKKIPIVTAAVELDKPDLQAEVEVDGEWVITGKPKGTWGIFRGCNFRALCSVVFMGRNI